MCTVDLQSFVHVDVSRALYSTGHVTALVPVNHKLVIFACFYRNISISDVEILLGTCSSFLVNLKNIDVYVLLYLESDPIFRWKVTYNIHNHRLSSCNKYLFMHIQWLGTSSSECWRITGLSGTFPWLRFRDFPYRDFTSFVRKNSLVHWNSKDGTSSIGCTYISTFLFLCWSVWYRSVMVHLLLLDNQPVQLKCSFSLFNCMANSLRHICRWYKFYQLCLYTVVEAVYWFWRANLLLMTSRWHIIKWLYSYSAFV